MRQAIKRSALLLAATVLFSSGSALVSAQPAAELSAFGKRIQSAMDSDIRGADDRLRDDNRKPIETLDFFGITEDMKVLELLPGNGWYTKLLALALADEGQLYVAFSNSIKPLIEKHPELSKI